MPPAYLDGIAAVEVSPKTLPHPLRGDVYTLGECIPLEWSGTGADLQSRVALYYGSFAALARQGAFDWRAEAWETLVHELRHHLEWRAHVDALEAYDWAAEENFKRHEGQAFDPAYYRSGEVVAPDVYKVDDDMFIERSGGRGGAADIVWHGRRYRVALPAAAPEVSVYLRLVGLNEPAPGDTLLVLPRTASLRGLFRSSPAPLERDVAVEPLDA